MDYLRGMGGQFIGAPLCLESCLSALSWELFDALRSHLAALSSLADPWNASMKGSLQAPFQLLFNCPGIT